jgi:hypothetical protein
VPETASVVSSDDFSVAESSHDSNSGSFLAGGGAGDDDVCAADCDVGFK